MNETEKILKNVQNLAKHNNTVDRAGIPPMRTDINKREIEERGERILNELARIRDLMGKGRRTYKEKIDMKKRLDGYSDSFRRLLFDLTTQ